MSRFIRCGAIALPAFLITAVIAAVSVPAHAASTWSAPVALPSGAVGVGQFAESTDGAQAAVWTTGAQGASSVVASTSSSGLTWTTPVTLDNGENPAVAISANGRVVAAWEGGPATATVIQASVLSPGGTWSAPVNVSTDAFGGPVIGMDGSGNAIVAWLGAAREIRTASLPAGGSWTAVHTLDTQVDGFALNLAVNSAGSAVISWAEPLRTIMADSGTILGGFGMPVTPGAAHDSLRAQITPDIPQVNSAYLHGHTDVVLSNSGEASLVGSITTTVHNVTTRTAAGTWGDGLGLPLPGPNMSQPDLETAIDGAGDIVTVYDQDNPSGVVSVYITRLPAGSSTWSTPVVLASPASLAMVAGDTAGTFVAAMQTGASLSVLTSPPGGSFGAATTFSGVSATDLVMAPGHAAVVLSSGAVSTEPVS
jgi:hypothetical protein